MSRFIQLIGQQLSTLGGLALVNLLRTLYSAIANVRIKRLFRRVINGQKDCIPIDPKLTGVTLVIEYQELNGLDYCAMFYANMHTSRVFLGSLSLIEKLGTDLSYSIESSVTKEALPEKDKQWDHLKGDHSFVMSWKDLFTFTQPSLNFIAENFKAVNAKLVEISSF